MVVTDWFRKQTSSDRIVKYFKSSLTFLTEQYHYSILNFIMRIQNMAIRLEGIRLVSYNFSHIKNKTINNKRYRLHNCYFPLLLKENLKF